MRKGHEKLGEKTLSYLGFHFVRGHLGLLKDVPYETILIILFVSEVQKPTCIVLQTPESQVTAKQEKVTFM